MKIKIIFPFFLLINNCFGTIQLLFFNDDQVINTSTGISITFKWTTVQEINNEYFRIYKSDDRGNSWYPIGNNIPGAGLGSFNNYRDYNTTIFIPSNISKYYKLKQVDTDGNYTFSFSIQVPQIATNWNTIQFTDPPLCEEFFPLVEVFSDNFDGNDLNPLKWHVQDWNSTDFALSRQKWSENNVTVGNGILRIQGRNDNVSGLVVTSWDPLVASTEQFAFSSGMIESKQKFAWGKVEAKCKIPKGWGLWPAFWMYGEANTNNEIDVFEFWNPSDISNLSTNHNMSVHYNGAMSLDSYEGTIDFSLQPHIFTVEWVHDKIEWSIDNSLVKRTYPRYREIDNKETICPSLYMLHNYLNNPLFPREPMSILFDLAIQNTSGNTPNSSSTFPANFDIDYVKFYTHLNCNKNVNECNFHLDNVFENSVVAARSITIGGPSCSAYVNNLEFLTLIGSESVNLLPGFIAEQGSNLDIRIVNVCGIHRIKDVTSEEINLDSITKFEVPFTIFPNPVIDILNVRPNIEFGKLECVLFNNLNQVILQKKDMKRDFQINFSDLPSGIYILKLNLDNNFVSTIKIVHL